MPSTVYDPTRTLIVDNNNSSLLVRGNLPLDSNNNFTYDALASTITNLVPNFDLTKYNLIDISVLDNQAEINDLTSEFKTFGETNIPSTLWPPASKGVDLTKLYGKSVQGHKGSIVWYPVQGCIGNCSIVEPQFYKFVELIDFIQRLYLIPNTVVYFHCEHGHDRTGSVAASYYMKYKNMSLKDAMKKAKTFGHDWEPPYDGLIRYYADSIGRK